MFYYLKLSAGSGINGELCVLGGYLDDYVYSPVECYDEVKNKWRLVNFIKFDTDVDTCTVVNLNNIL